MSIPPWLLRTVGSHSETTDALLPLQAKESAGFAVKFLRGKKMATIQGLFDEFAAALQFPYYFGNNWDAFDECLVDLDWLPAKGYLLTIFDSADLLSSEAPAQLNVLLKVLEQACLEWNSPVAVGEWWDRPAMPFHVLFHCRAEDLPRLPTKIAALSELRLSTPGDGSTG